MEMSDSTWRVCKHCWMRKRLEDFAMDRTAGTRGNEGSTDPAQGLIQFESFTDQTIVVRRRWVCKECRARLQRLSRGRGSTGDAAIEIRLLLEDARIEQMTGRRLLAR